ncbi:MAG: FIST C-terminal domain-containing protein [Pirellula sp.]|jgi:small ligand-binding sensory domain FIST
MKASASLSIAPVNASSHQESLRNAVCEAMRAASESLGVSADIAIVFVRDDALTPADAERLIETVLRPMVGDAILFGGVVDSLVGTAQEVEHGIAASVLLLGEMRGAARAFSMECIETPDGWSVMGLDEDVHRDAVACGGLLTIACPFTFSADMLYSSLEALAPIDERPAKVFGGNISRMARRGGEGSPSMMFLGDRLVTSGAIGLLLPDSVEWSAVVSQGSRPIGEPMIVTEVSERSIVSLGGKPALDRLRDMFHTLPNREREMAMRLLLIGRAISEYSETFSHGEFLIRNITGIDQETKAIQVADRMKVGQTVRFHLLDDTAADADLKQLTSRARSSGMEPVAGVLFSCNGRGERMFGVPGHDANVVEHYFPSMPLCGFFAAGEFGPVADQNLVHGFTAVVALLCDRGAS